MVQENTLKRTQVWVAILAGLVTFIVGAYNTKNIFFPEKKDPVQVSAPAARPSPVRSAVEDVSSSWIRKFGSPTPPNSATQ